MREVWIVLTSMLAVGLFIAAPEPASADEYADCQRGTSVCRPDTNPDHWCFGDSTLGPDRVALRQSIQWAINNAHHNTDINTSPMAGCEAAADARWREGGGLTNLVLGEYRCTDWAGPSFPEVCYSSDVIINFSAHQYYANDPDNIVSSSDGIVESGEIDLNRDLSACHEFGHHLGMAHHDLSWYQNYANDCLRSPWLEAEQAGDGWRKYNQHHIDHVNAHY